MRRCPACGSRDARRSHRSGRERWLGWLPFLPYRCRACKRRYWRFDATRPAALLLLALPAAALALVYMRTLPYGQEVSVEAPEVPAPAPETVEAPVVPEPPEEVGPTLEAITARVAGDRVTIELAGAAAPYRDYFLADPPRHVLELEGAWRLAAPENVLVGHPRVERVRAVANERTLWVEIFLAPEGRDDEPRVSETSGGLVVVFGS